MSVSTWTRDGTSPFADWFSRLDAVGGSQDHGRAGAHRTGERFQCQRRREGVLEYRLDFGPAIGCIFGRDGDVLVILLAGGTKKRQQRDIESAQARWAAYKRRKTIGEVNHGPNP